ncbi:hypothetical protein JZ751_000925 [Albula glossodonta]|uniref:Protein kinase domain-containing protein n=1 Tax=Albula glossodonta TaxID=121402 RepID=A0A8T2PXR5_9TELE|nr:hypothetical protein JZ751_000925 [Albula glossodonta]
MDKARRRLWSPQHSLPLLWPTDAGGGRFRDMRREPRASLASLAFRRYALGHGVINVIRGRPFCESPTASDSYTLSDTMSSRLVNSLAKIYDPKAAPSGTKPRKLPPMDPEDQSSNKFHLIHARIESLSTKMDKLINIQEKVLSRLDGMSQDIGDIEQDVETLKVDKEEVHFPPASAKPENSRGADQMKEICQEMTTMMSAVNQRSEQQAQKLEGMEKLVLSIQEVISFIGETVKGSRLMEYLFKGPALSRKDASSLPSKDHKGKQTIKGQVSGDKGEVMSNKKFSKQWLHISAAHSGLCGILCVIRPHQTVVSTRCRQERRQIPDCDASCTPLSLALKISSHLITAEAFRHGGPAAHERERPPHDKPNRCVVKGEQGRRHRRVLKRSVYSRRARKKQAFEKESFFFHLESASCSSADTISLKKQALLLEEVQKLNQQNAERSGLLLASEPQDLETGGLKEGTPATPMGQGGLDLLELLLEVPQAPPAEKENKEEEDEEEVEVVSEFETEEEEAKKEEEEEPPKVEAAKEEEKMMDVTPAASKGPSVCETPETKPPLSTDAPVKAADTPTDADSILERKEESESADSVSLEAEPSRASEVTTSSKRRVTEEDLEPEDHKKSRRVEEKEKEGVEEGGKEGEKLEEEEDERGREEVAGEGVAPQVEESNEAGEHEEEEVNLEEWKKAWIKRKAELEGEERKSEQEYIIDTSPPPSAPFKHRIVSAKPNQINNFYTINRQEVLGGGRFGQVHKCIENSSGLTLAAKIIKARSVKEKEEVKNEIQVMNQLDHANLIQLYAAYESRNDIILVLEYVDGGELFDRIIDENYKLTELDTVHFIRQICEGLQHMHKMSIVHLDLKPENILCVSRLTNKIKIIDFGLARNGLSPFLGDDDNQTLNNILACEWNFEEDEFIDISEEAKDFISRLLITNKRRTSVAHGDRPASLYLTVKKIGHQTERLSPLGPDHTPPR